MRKMLFLSSFFISLSLYLIAQSKPVLTGHINGLPDGTKVWIVMSAVNKDSAISRNGTFVFYGHGLDKGSYSLRLNREYITIKWKDILIDNSPLIITASDTLLNDFRMKGAPWTKDGNDFEKFTSPDRKKLLDYLPLFAKATENKDTVLNSKLSKEYTAIRLAYIEKKWDWVNNHKSSLFANFLITSDDQLALYYSPARKDSLLATMPLKDGIFYRAMRDEVNAYKGTAIGNMAPLFVQNDVNGKPFNLKSFRGSYVLLDFWASWCVPCREENPNVLAAYNLFKEKNFKIVAISLDNKKDLWKEAVVKDGLPWLQLSDLRGWQNKVSEQYYIHSIPANVLISPEGKIVAKNLRAEKLVKTLEEFVK
ncbi:MAG: TlpA disulfide reductase family protein [Bacteroidota bacterium]